MARWVPRAAAENPCARQIKLVDPRVLSLSVDSSSYTTDETDEGRRVSALLCLSGRLGTTLNKLFLPLQTFPKRLSLIRNAPEHDLTIPDSLSRLCDLPSLAF